MNTEIGNSRPARVLIVEDEQPIADYLASLLNEVALTAEIATTVERAMSLITGQSFDLAFIDLELPDRSGLELIDSVQRERPTLPIVISTGYGDRVLQDSILAQRHVHLLQKPYTLADVTAVLVKCGLHARPAPMPMG